MKLPLASALFAVLMCSSIAVADELEVVKLDESPPSDELSADVLGALQDTGWKVRSGPDRTVCDLWLAKAWPVAADFTPSPSVQYPFTPGELLGVIRFKRRTQDFRGQEVQKGLYTLRYALQPEDGNHIGTSDTRDFLALVKAESDKQPGPMAVDTLMGLSAEASGTTHPAILSLVSNEGQVPKEPKLTHDDARDWTILIVSNPAKDGEGNASQQAVGVVIVGQSAE